MDCLFCKIASGELSAHKLFEDEEILAFYDITAVAPTHVLIIPKQHIATLNDIDTPHHALLAKMFVLAQQLAVDQGISKDGYRLVMNVNPAGGQSVYHIHLHLLGGRQMTWPPG